MTDFTDELFREEYMDEVMKAGNVSILIVFAMDDRAELENSLKQLAEDCYDINARYGFKPVILPTRMPDAQGPAKKMYVCTISDLGDEE